MQDAGNRQDEIGWERWFQGFHDTIWAQQQMKQYNQIPKAERKKHHTGDVWNKRLISWIWTTIQGVWKIRNHDKHGDTPQTAVWKR